MRVTQYPVALVTNDEQEFSVGFEQTNTINDKTACFLQTLRFLDIVFLVKTRLHLEQYRYVLAILGRVQERLRDA